MLLKYQKRNLSAWLKERLTHLHKGTNKTVSVVVDKTEIDNLDFLGHLSKSKDFKLDLNMQKSYWVYHPDTLKRVLLV